MLYDTTRIQTIIPHRYPFLMVDRIEWISEDKTEIEGIKCVSANELFFTGHFPGKPVMPGVLITEALAQTGAVLLLDHPENAGKIPLFAGIVKMRFVRQVVPGDVLHLHVKLKNCKAGIYFAGVEAKVDGTRAAVGEIMCALQENES